jgi:hypothetical protein
MALNRRTFLLSVPFAATTVACAGSGQRGHADGVRELARSEQASSGAPRVLVLMPETKQTWEVWRGISDELGKDFRLAAVRVDGTEGAGAIARAIERYRPFGIVLMNNPTVALYREYQRTSRAQRFPPAVIVMTSFLEGQAHQVAAATGISYEVPLITVITNLRKLIATPIDRVGVVHRPGLAGFVADQAQIAAREQTVLLRQQVSPRPNSSEIKRAIRELKKTSQAIWVLNDDRLLSPDQIASGWLPGLNERPFVPVIVGAGSLVSPSQSFGTFAVLPDHTALGVQAANLLFDIADHDWLVPADEAVQLPLSTTTTIDLTQARERFSLRGDALSRVDMILEL